MKKGVSSGVSDALLGGKTAIILAVITISAFSFSLGYFAGKKSGNFEERNLIEAKIEKDKNKPAVSPDEFDREIDRAIKKDLEVAPDVKRVSVTSPSGEYETSRLAIENVEPDGNTYSVQVGAFKKLEDAKRLKNRLTDHGYNSYIVTVNYAKGNVYKVRADRYASREEAELSAHKIKQIKGLDAFVLIEK
ncbi:MAG: SPOR domain-containing protein [Nitrospirota bacterium]|nr:MAG: SPOR domain-containing protein [Nitrospirota bacterium]